MPTRMATLLLLSACAASAPPPSPQPLKFIADERLAGFRLLDVTPRTVALSGGEVRLSWSGVPADAGSFLYVVVGESFSPMLDNLGGAIQPGAGATSQLLRLPPHPEGVWDLSLLDEYRPDAGRLGALVDALTYQRMPGAPGLTLLSPGPINFTVPLRANLATKCARKQLYQVANVGDEVIENLTLEVSGDGFSLPSACPPTLTLERPCLVEVCFGSATPGVQRGSLRASAGDRSATIELSGTVLEPLREFSWQRPGRAVFAVSGKRTAAFFEGSSVLLLIDDGATLEVALGASERVAALAGDATGSFAAIVVEGPRTLLTSIGPTGTRGVSTPIDSQQLIGLGRGRVLTVSGLELTAWTVQPLAVDTTWGQSGKYRLPPNFPQSAAATGDGRLFFIDGVTTVELSPSGQFAATHQHAANLVSAAGDGTVLIVISQTILRWYSNGWGFRGRAPSGLFDLAIDSRGRLLVTHSSRTERLRSDSSIEASFPLGSIECAEAGLCVGTGVGVNGLDPYLARIPE